MKILILNTRRPSNDKSKCNILWPMVFKVQQNKKNIKQVHHCCLRWLKCLLVKVNIKRDLKLVTEPANMSLINGFKYLNMKCLKV